SYLALAFSNVIGFGSKAMIWQSLLNIKRLSMLWPLLHPMSQRTSPGCVFKNLMTRKQCSTGLFRTRLNTLETAYRTSTVQGNKTPKLADRRLRSKIVYSITRPFGHFCQ